MESLVEIQKKFKFKTDKYRNSDYNEGHTYLKEYDKIFKEYKNGS